MATTWPNGSRVSLLSGDLILVVDASNPVDAGAIILFLQNEYIISNIIFHAVYNDNANIWNANSL